jgi:hypothetical protein
MERLPPRHVDFTLRSQAHSDAFHFCHLVIFFHKDVSSDNHMITLTADTGQRSRDWKGTQQ